MDRFATSDEIRRVSSGTLSYLLGSKGYEAIDAFRAAWLDWELTHYLPPRYASWQDSLNEFVLDYARKLVDGKSYEDVYCGDEMTKRLILYARYIIEGNVYMASRLAIGDAIQQTDLHFAWKLLQRGAVQG